MLSFFHLCCPFQWSGGKNADRGLLKGLEGSLEVTVFSPRLSFSLVEGFSLQALYFEKPRALHRHMGLFPELISSTESSPGMGPGH